MDNEYNYHAEQLANVKPGKVGDYAATFQIRNGEERTKWMDLHDKSANELVKWLCEYYTPELLTERNTLASLLEAGDGLRIAQVAKEAQKGAFLQIELQAQKEANAELLKERDTLKVDLNEADETNDLLSKRIDDLTIINAELLEALKLVQGACVVERASMSNSEKDHISKTVAAAIAKAEGREHAK